MKLYVRIQALEHSLDHRVQKI